MYGWRAKIGHVAPSRGDTLVYEFYQMLPTGFMILNSTGTIRQLVDADFERQLQRIEEAAADLVDNKCDSIIIGGSPLFTKLGYGSDIEMGQKLSAKFGVPVSPGITGEVEALKSLNLKKLVVATPHEDTLNERMKAFLEASGFKVLKIHGYGVRKNADLTDMTSTRRIKSPSGFTNRRRKPTASLSPARAGRRSRTSICSNGKSASRWSQAAKRIFGTR
jgi:maleate isomerase